MVSWKKYFPKIFQEPKADTAGFEAVDPQREFLSFYEKLSAEMVSHLDYQMDMTRTMGTSPAEGIVKEFKLTEYSAKVWAFLREHDLTEDSNGEHAIGTLMLLVLLPPTPWHIDLSRELREQLFCTTVSHYIRGTGKDISLFIKGLYDRIKFGESSFYDHSREELIEILRSAASRINVEIRGAQKTGSGNNENGKRKNDAMPGYLFDSLGIRNSHDLERLLSKTLPIDGLVAVILLMVIAITMMLRPDIPQKLIGVFSADAEMLLTTGVFGGLATVLLLLSVLRAFTYGKTLQRRHILLRLLKRAVVMGFTDRESVRIFVLKRFGIKKKLI